MTRWAEVVDFSMNMGANITWGLSYPVASGTEGTWNSTNPAAFLAHIAANSTQSQVIQGGIELGEEIDPHQGESAMFQQYADSWPVFASIRNKLWPDHRPQTYGPCPGMPSFTNVSDFWIPMLNQTAHQNSMDVVVYHSYNNPPSWPWLLDQTLGQARVLVALVEAIDTAAGLPQPRRVVLGEGGPHNGGGIMGITNTFASSSYYMDALGLLPVVGVTGFNRQALVGGDYELLNRTTFLPNPDYWVAYGYRLLVGPKVLSATSLAPSDPVLNSSLRIYAHCAETSNPDRAGKGDVVIFWSSADVRREYHVSIGALQTLSKVDMYVLTPHGAAQSTAVPVNVFTKSIDLNGQLLALGPSDELPPWTPSSLPAGTTEITIPPAAVGWAVLRGASAAACL
jgi:heparanase 1